MNVFLIIPFIFFLMSSYFFNYEKLTVSKNKIRLISLCTAIISYLIVLVFFFETSINIFLIYFVLLLSIFIIGYILVLYLKSIVEDAMLVLETMKNNMILFTLGFLPFYLFLSILRFESLVIQLSVSILSPIVLVVFSIYLQKVLKHLYIKIARWFDFASAAKFVALWIVLLFFSIFIFIIQIPTNQLSKSANLSDSSRYPTFNRFPTDLQNNYRSVNVFSEAFDDFLSMEITDFYFDGRYLYTYTKDDLLTVFDITNNTTVQMELIGPGLNFDNLDYPMKVYNKFFTVNDTLYILGLNSFYKVDATTTTLIDENFSIKNSVIVFINDQFKLLNKVEPLVYDLYTLEDETLIFSERFDLEALGYDALTVISYNLFFESDNTFIHHQTGISYPKILSESHYDSINKKMIYITEWRISGNAETRYTRVDQDGRLESFKLNNHFNSIGLFHQENLYLVQELSNPYSLIEPIQIMNNQFSFTALHKPLRTQFLFQWEGYANAYLADIIVYEDTVAYLLVEYHAEEIRFTLVKLEPEILNFSFPMYSHFTLTYFIPIFIALFIPMTQTPSITTIIGFDTFTKKKDD